MKIILTISDLKEQVNKNIKDFTLSDFREEFQSSFEVADIVLFEKGKDCIILSDHMQYRTLEYNFEKENNAKN